jgi:hypothetical protein
MAHCSMVRRSCATVVRSPLLIFPTSYGLNGGPWRPALLAAARLNEPYPPTGATIPRWGNEMPHRPLN